MDVRAWLGTFLLLLGSADARAAVASISLDELSARSLIIVVGHVTAVTMQDGARTATLQVEQALKGQPGPTVRFLAEPSWTCDSATAVDGERLLLFLGPAKNAGGPLRIAHSGRGRLPLRNVGEVEHAAIWVHDVRLPASLQPRSSPSGLTVETLVPAETLIRYIKRESLTRESAPKP